MPKDLDKARLIQDLDIIDFCGPNAKTYVEWHYKALSGNGYAFGISWLCLLLPPAWYAYRRLWGFFFGYCAIIAFIITIEESLSLKLPLEGATLGVTGALAASARYHFMQKTYKYIKKADQLGLSGQERRAFLKSHGGVSPLLSASVFIVLIALMLIPFFLEAQGF